MNRLEAKYLLPLEGVAELRTFLEQTTVRDPNIPAQATGYRVSSIYFDTPGLDEYAAKMDGQALRRKVRLRWYGGIARQLLLEGKFRDHDGSQKVKLNRCLGHGQDRFRAAELSLFFADEAKGSLLEEPLRAIGQRLLRPIVGINYWRDAFSDPHYDYLRVTIDSQVRARPVDEIELAWGEPWLYCVDPALCIVEIKTQAPVPAWTRWMIRRFGMTRTALSKYCHGVEKFLAHGR